MFQQLYDNLPDRFDPRIGTFRMGLALTPIAAEATAHAVRGDFPVHAFESRPINARSLKFRSRWTTLGIFYLFFFTSSFLFHHSVGGLGVVVIVHASCIVARPRSTREKRRRSTDQTT